MNKSVCVAEGGGGSRQLNSAEYAMVYELFG